MKNFLQGRESLKSVVAKPSETSAGPMGNLNPSKSHSCNDTEPSAHGVNPEVEVISENGRVQRIIVTCTCGKSIELECQY